MQSLPKPEIIFTHESDLDGLISGLLLKRLAQKLFGEEIPLEAYHNQSWRQRAFHEKSAWVADMTFETRLDRVNWLVIDHHATDVVAQDAVLVHDTGKSAGLLCYELCKEHGFESPALDRLVHLSNVADLFLEKDPDFDLANDYANLVKTYQFWNLIELIQRNPEQLLDHPLLEVMAVKRRVEDPLGYAWSLSNITELSPYVGFVDTMVGNINLIVHQLLETAATPYSALLTLFRKANGTIIVSVRSRNGDALRIAEKLHGGGHANASGATLPRSVQSVSEAVRYLRHILSPAAPAAGPSNESLENAFDSVASRSERNRRKEIRGNFDS
ncbi:MAG: DHHA1 domain-containing protein [Verrucomicrobia bacterium]|nr:DHHA1 domain-containing protein [Verrucomicrobiota bacterium]